MCKSKKQTVNYWLPLEEQKGTYVVASNWLRSQLPLIEEVKLCSFLQKHFRVQAAVVDLGRHVVKAQVYVPIDLQENAYILVDKDMMPIEAEPSPHSVPTDIASYFNRLRNELAHSEALFPNQQSFLWTEFLQPRLAVRMQPNGDARELPDWRDIQKSTRVLLIGSPGAGKTTLMRRLAIELADVENEDSSTTIPVYVQLREWSSAKSIEHLVRRGMSRMGHSDVVKQLDSLGSAGKIHFLFDGLDEVESEIRDTALTDIRKYMEGFDRCRFVVSGRPGNYLRNFEGEAVFFELRPWSRSQIQELCWLKLASTSHSYERFWSRISAEDDVSEIASNPLTLSLLLASYLRDNLSPHFQTEVVTSAINVFVHEWDSVRGVRRNIASKVTPHRKTALLRHLAGQMILEDKNSFSLEEFCRLIENFNIEDEPARVLRFLAEETGLIVAEENDRWAFSHRCFQECLAASFLVDKVMTTNNYEKESGHSWWMRVFRYVSSLASDASLLLKPYLESRFAEENAILLAEAMSQNLLIERSTISGFGLYLVGVLEQLLNGVHDDVAMDAVEVGKNWEMMVRLNGPKSRTQDTAASIIRLVTAIHKVRDGVARHEVERRLKSSKFEMLVKLSELLSTDGQLSCTEYEIDNEYRVHMKLVQVRERT